MATDKIKNTRESATISSGPSTSKKFMFMICTGLP